MEFAILVPVLLAILVGVIEWGFVLWAQTSFVNATRDGARLAVVIQDWNTNNAVEMTRVKQTVADRLMYLPSSMKRDIRNNITVQLLPNTVNPESVRVSIVQQPYRSVIGLGLIPVPATLSAAAEFRYEGSPQ